MNDADWLAQRFEEHRPHLRTVAYRMLGSANETEDAVQEAWIRLSRGDGSEIDNLGGWLTTVVGRVCLDMLRARRARPEQLVGDDLPEPVVVLDDSANPEQQALIADSIGLAMLVVLDTLTPSERLAFVLHDMFAVPFDEIAPIVERSPEATRQLASRARRRVQGAEAHTASDLRRQRKIIDAFLAAARAADFDALVAVLDPDVVLRSDIGSRTVPLKATVSGIRAVAEQILPNSRAFVPIARPAIVNGAAGLIIGNPEAPAGVCGFIFEDDKITEIDLTLDPEKLPRPRRAARNAT